MGRVDPASFTLKGLGDTHQVQILFRDSLYFSNFTLKLLREKRRNFSLTTLNQDQNERTSH